ncbi:extracellular solute-binding protein [Paraburkholderia sp.]|uniref:extracellular solute-binding protein n=1 Tax=Paraburkholderia sp. TaxID=1926495 RepID=UPI003C7B6205
MEDVLKKQAARRKFMKQVAIGCAAGAVMNSPIVARAQGSKDEINLLTWETYSEDPWLAEWSKTSGVKVNAVRVASVDELFAKITSGAVSPDVIYVDTSTIPRLLGLNYLSPIDISQVPNTKNISPAIQYQKSNSVNGKLYALPYNWGPIPMMYNSSVLKDRTDSWKILWDEKLKGRVAVTDDSLMTLSMVALVAGAANPYHMTDREFDKVTELLRSLRPQVKAITSGNNDTQTLFASGEVDVGMCMNLPIVENLKNAGKPISYSIPKEGVPSWLDCAMITKRGNRKVVYDFLNATLSLSWQKRFIEFATSPGVLDVKTATATGVKPAVINETVMPLLDKPGFWSSMRLFQGVEDPDRRLQLWNDFKAGTL